MFQSLIWFLKRMILYTVVSFQLTEGRLFTMKVTCFLGGGLTRQAAFGRDYDFNHLRSVLTPFFRGYIHVKKPITLVYALSFYKSVHSSYHVT